LIILFSVFSFVNIISLVTASPSQGWHPLNIEGKYNGKVQISPYYGTEVIEVIEEGDRVRFLVTDAYNDEPRTVRIQKKLIDDFFNGKLWGFKIENSEHPQHSKELKTQKYFKQAQGFIEIPLTGFSTNEITAEEVTVSFESIDVRINYRADGIGNESYYIPTIDDGNGTGLATSGDFVLKQGRGMENYTFFTEVDNSTLLTVAGDNINYSSIVQQSTAYVYETLDTAVSGDFLAKGSFKMNTSGEDSIQHYFTYGDTIGTASAQTNYISIRSYGESSLRLIKTGESEDIWAGASLSTRYWWTMNRTGSTVTLYIYNDSARTELQATLSQTESASFSYVYGFQSRGSGASNPSTGEVYAIETATGLDVTNTTTTNINNSDLIEIVSADNNTNYSLYYENLNIFTEILNNETATITIQKDQNASETAPTNETTVRFLLPFNMSVINVTNSTGNTQNYTYIYGTQYNTLLVNLTYIDTVGDLINITVEGQTSSYFIEILADPPRVRVNNTFNTSETLFIKVQGDPSLFINSTPEHITGVTWLERGTAYSAFETKDFYYDPKISIYPASGATINTLAYENNSQVLNLTLQDATSNNDSHIYLADKVRSSISCQVDGTVASPAHNSSKGWRLNMTFVTNTTNINCTYPPKVWSIIPADFDNGDTFKVMVNITDQKDGSTNLTAKAYWAYNVTPEDLNILNLTYNPSSELWESLDFQPLASYNIWVESTDIDGASINSTVQTVTTSVLQNHNETFDVPSGATKVMAGVYWYGLSEGSGVTISLTDTDDNETWNEFQTPTIVKQFKTALIPLPLIYYNVTVYSGYKELIYSNTSVNGTWRFILLHTNITKVETEIGWS
jgi:hypothetical protein